MTDSAFHLAAANPFLPDPQQQPREYSYQPPASDPRRRPSFAPLQLPLPLRQQNLHGNGGSSSMSPTDIQPEPSTAGVGIAYGGPHPAVMQTSGHNSSLLSDLVFPKPSVEPKLTRDGQPAKRRGPKPDSKPAMTRRQELNRQAQRWVLDTAFWLEQQYVELRADDHSILGRTESARNCTSKNWRAPFSI